MTTTTPSALDQLLLDLFTTALEGGIQYWANVQTYHWNTMPNVVGQPAPWPVGEDHQGFYADIIDADEEATDRRIDRSVLAKGYRLATTDWRHRIAWSSGQEPSLVVGPDTDWDFDASDADVIVQLGLFGEPVYS